MNRPPALPGVTLTFSHVRSSPIVSIGGHESLELFEPAIPLSLDGDDPCLLHTIRALLSR